jgi:hypothetical protein
MSTSLIVPARIAEKLNERAESCGACRWRNKPASGNGDIECRAHPPTASLNLMPVQGPLARPGQQAAALQAFSVFPLVKDDMWCGEWAPKPSAVQ